MTVLTNVFKIKSDLSGGVTMPIMMQTAFAERFVYGMLAAVSLASLPVAPAHAQGLNFNRASVAKSATFTLTQSVEPKGGSKVSQVYKVEVSGQKARVDHTDPNFGATRFIVNEKGFFLYTPATKSATKQQIKGGIDGALNTFFAQVKEQLKGAKKTGTAQVSGQPTDVYKDPKAGITIYVGKNPGFRLPVKTVQTNVGGTRTLLITGIKLNPKIAPTEFVLPAGTQMIEGNGAAGGAISGGL